MVVWCENRSWELPKTASHTSLVFLFPEHLFVAVVGEVNTELGSLFV